LCVTYFVVVFVDILLSQGSIEKAMGSLIARVCRFGMQIISMFDHHKRM